MTELYIPFCQGKSASEELLTSHRTYLHVRYYVHYHGNGECGLWEVLKCSMTKVGIAEVVSLKPAVIPV